MNRAFKVPYIYFTIGIFFTYIIINIILSKFYVTLSYIPYYLDTLNWPKFILSIFFSLVIAFLISINTVYMYILYKAKKKVSKEGYLTCAATIGGFATGVCTACTSGIIAALLSIFGFSWSLLPFQGLEIQLLIILILITSLWMIRKNEKNNNPRS